MQVLSAPHPAWLFRDNPHMDAKKLREVVAANIERFKGDESHGSLARRAHVGQSHISRLLRGESSATTDMLAALAKALNVQPWELLADDEATRHAAMQKMLGVSSRRSA